MTASERIREARKNGAQDREYNYADDNQAGRVGFDHDDYATAMNEIHLREVDDPEANTVDNRCPECNQYVSECECDDEDACDSCGASLSLDEGEGYDGLCGTCADIAERNGRWS